MGEPAIRAQDVTVVEGEGNDRESAGGERRRHVRESVEEEIARVMARHPQLREYRRDRRGRRGGIYIPTGAARAAELSFSAGPDDSCQRRLSG